MHNLAERTGSERNSKASDLVSADTLHGCVPPSATEVRPAPSITDFCIDFRHGQFALMYWLGCREAACLLNKRLALFVCSALVLLVRLLRRSASRPLLPVAFFLKKRRQPNLILLQKKRSACFCNTVYALTRKCFRD
jgi:hypothetical protein